MTEKNEDQLFIPQSFFLVRTPRLPIDVFFQSLNHADLNQFLSSFYKDTPIFREAIAVASSTLSETLSSPKKLKPKEQKQIYSSLLLYFIRMATRSTPFGLFSFVAWGEWSEKSEAYFNLDEVTKRSRPDMEWLFKIIDQLVTNPSLFHLLKIQRNPLIYESGDRIYLAYIRQKEKTDIQKTVSIRATFLTKAIVNLARVPISIECLVKKLIEEFPNLEASKLQEVIHTLIDQQFLSFDIQPSLLTESPFKDLLDKLSKYLEIESITIHQLFNLEAELQSYDQVTNNDGETKLKVISQSMKKLASASNFLQVDSVNKEQKVKLPSKISYEVAQGIDVLWRLSFLKEKQLLKSYHDQFLEKYGTQRLVPLLTLLNEESGLGIPGHYKNNSFLPTEPNEEEKKWNTWLKDKWADAILNKQHEIVITDDVIDKCSNKKKEDKEKCPISLDVYFEVFANSIENLDSGNYLISLFSHTLQAGNTFGRLIDLFKNEEKEELKFSIAKEEAVEKDCLFIESSYIPTSSRSANVSTQPLFRKYVIDLGNGSHPNSIALEDIYVGGNLERLFLVTKDGKQKLKVVFGNVLNPAYAPTPLRFIREVSQSSYQTIQPLSWGSLADSSFLPRIRYKKTILSLAQWNVDINRLEINSKASEEIIEQAFNKWADKWQLPRYVFMTEADNKILFDRHHFLHIQELVAELKKGKKLKLVEKIGQEMGQWIQSPLGLHSSEFVLPLIKNPKYSSNSLRASFPYFEYKAHERLKLPGSEWLFIKVFLGKENENRFLTQHLAPFCKEMLYRGIIDDWFFIRYGEKNHLRIRFHGLPQKLLSELFPILHQWTLSLLENNWISDIQFSTYEREIERYGGLEVINEIEAFFCADSKAALELIKIYAIKKDATPDFIVCIVSAIYLLKQLGLNIQSQISLLSHSDKNLLNGFREWKSYFFNKIGILMGDKEIEQDKELDLFKRAFQLRNETCHKLSEKLIHSTTQLAPHSFEAILRSLLHMHCNRLISYDAKLENKVYQYMLHALTSYQASQKVLV